MSKTKVEGISRKTSLGKTKSEIIYELVKINAKNEQIRTIDVVLRSKLIYDDMVEMGIIVEYEPDDPNYPVKIDNKFYA